MHLGGSTRTAALALAAATALGAGTTVLAPSPALAAGGLGESGTTRYVVSEDGSPVQVTQTVTVTNEEPPTATRYFYWTGYGVWLPSAVGSLRGTSNGSSIPVTVVRQKGQYYADISFPSELRYGQTRTVTLTYTIPGSPVRSSQPGRVGKGYAAFDVYSPGDAGRATIEVVSPRWITLDLGLPYTESGSGDTRVATIRGGGPEGLWTQMSLRDPSQIVKHDVQVGPYSFSLQAFPGDTGWSSYIAGRLPSSVTTLERLTGQPWPNRSTTITEDFSGQVYGWDGSYERGRIDVSEALDPALLAHELSHAWSNFDHLDDRWLTEGLAQELATETTAATGQKDTSHPSVSPTQASAFPLADWQGSTRAGSAEDYAYPASWQVVHDLVAGSTAVPRPQLIKALTTTKTIYDAPGERTITTHATTWRQAYDLFEVLGGNTGTRALMSRWVLDPEGKALLPARASARTAYAAQDAADGAWSLPRGVRTAMADWDFARAGRELALTRALGPQAKAAQAAATAADIDVAPLRTAYQSAQGAAEYREVGARLAAFAREATALRSTRSEVDSAGPLARLGDLVLQPRADLDRAEAAIAKGDTATADAALADARTGAARATLVGAGLLLAAVLLMLALVLSLRRATRRGRRRDRRTTGAPAADGGPAGGPAGGQPSEGDGPAPVTHAGVEGGDARPAAG
ncbi:hypothetical protein ACFUC1_08885 [Pedococcus sp. NPDC057267]|uniref:hypothetical protein n=1 Tax=Pedococcus sp. NPDC057267 TaxID=3346077 RepID=UPI00362AB34F